VQVEAAFMEGPAELERLFSISPDGYPRLAFQALEKRDELDRQISRNARSKIMRGGPSRTCRLLDSGRAVGTTRFRSLSAAGDRVVPAS